MFASMFLFEAASGNLLFGFMPEQLGLLAFGVALVAVAVCSRRVLNRSEKTSRRNN